MCERNLTNSDLLRVFDLCNFLFFQGVWGSFQNDCNAVYLLTSPESLWNGPYFNFFPIFRTVRYNPYISVQTIINVWLLFTLTAPKEFGIPVLANVSKLTYIVKVSFKPMAGWNRNISNWPCGTTPLFKTADYKVGEEHDYHGQNHCNPHWIRVR